MNQKSNRKYYIDNLRSLCILLLFPFHAAMIYVDFGESWYIHGQLSRAATIFNMVTFPWWMSGLFVLAGMSSIYAMKKRTVKQYIIERVKKLWIPLLAAIVLIIPSMCYIADVHFNGYQGNYFSHFKTFLSVTDFSGYDGHFTPGHCWFILYLFVISVACAPLLGWYQKKKNKLNVKRITMPVLISLFLIPTLCNFILDIGGKSVGEYASYFLLGCFVLSEEEVQKKLQKHAVSLFAVCVLFGIARCVFYTVCEANMISWPALTEEIVATLIYRLFAWFGIMAMLGLGKRFLEFHTPLTDKFAAASYPIYLFHQSVIVIVGFYVLQWIDLAIVQYIIITVTSFLISFLLYYVCKQFRVTRVLFGISNKGGKAKMGGMKGG